ncbi:MAG: DUF2029 domain-containing protein [Flavobacteriaceae bacterium]|nr:DUF2029 domain-containing protein [Flavobacteriaceae bacterium]
MYKIINLIKNKRRIYLIGFSIVFLISLRQAIRLIYRNFQIFSFGSLDFWNNTNPYLNWHHLSILGKPLDVFLYTPLFSVLFTPFALLPGWLGIFCWNLFGYTLFYFSVYTLPDKFNFSKKNFIFLISALLLFNTINSIQFNPVVASLFLFSYTLLEKKHGFWAVLLILVSGLTKIYGIFQLVMLLFYPKFWKNALYAVLIGIVLLLIPLIHLTPSELVLYYKYWIETLMKHSTTPLRFHSIYRPICLLFSSVEQIKTIITLGVFVIIFLFTIVRLKLFKESFLHRAQFLGILMSWTILFGFSTELHTYVIAVVGYAIWYLSSAPTKLDKVLLWSNFMLLAILPIDLLFPRTISHFIITKLNIGVIVFSITWFIMVYKTFTSQYVVKELNSKSSYENES